MEKEKKEVDEKYIKAICINIVKAIIVIFYFLILNLISEKIGEELFRRGIQICTMIFLFIAIYIIEKAYKEDDGVKAIDGIEVLVLATAVLTLEYITNRFKFQFNSYSSTVSYVFAIYFVLKSIVIYTKGRKEVEKSLSDIEEIVKKEEPIKKEATKKRKEKVEEIENYLESQISGMLFLYLQQLQTQKQNTETLDAIAELKIISQRMNEMLSAVGKNVLKDSKEYEEVIENQDIMLLHFFKDMFYDNVVFDQERNYPLEKCNAIIDTSLDLLFSKENIEKLTISQSKESSFHKTIEQIWLDFDLDLMLSENSIKINKINLHKIMTNYIDKIYPIIEKRPEMFDKMKEIFHNDSLEAITGLPF